MTQIKKFAWSATSVALAALMAVTMLVAVPQTAEAADNDATCTGLAFSAPVQAAGLTETWTLTCTFTDADTNDGIAAGETITVTFPSNFTVPSSPTVTINDGAAILATSTATGSNGVVTITTAGAGDVANTETLTITVAGVKNPAAGAYTANATQSTTAGFSISHAEMAATQVAAAGEGIWDLNLTKSPSSVAADGASTVTVTMTASNAAANAGSAAQIVTISTDLGTFTGAASTGTTVFQGPAAPASDGKTATAGVAANVATTAGAAITIKAPTTVGTATIQVRVTPATGGAAVLIGITTVSFTAPAAVPGAVTSGSVTPTATTNVTSTGTTPTITATFVDANGNAPLPGGTVTVNTTLGVLTAGTGISTCTNQSCTGTLASNGQASVTLTGGGVAGTATVTFTTGGVSVSKTVTITGAVDTLTAKIQADADGAGAGTAFADTATPGATTFGAGGGVRISVDPKDSAGNRVPSVSPVITVAPSGCVTIGATTASTSTAAATTVLTAGNGSVGATCTLTATSGTKTATATLVIGAALASTSTLEITAADMSTVATQTVTVTVKSSTGALVQDGTSVTLVVSAGAVATSTVVTVNGVATFTYVSPGTAQQVNLTAVAGSVTTSKAIGVGVAGPVTPGAGGDGTLDREVPNVGVNTAVYNGGTVEQLSAAVTAAGGISVTVFIDGKATVLIPGAPAFVNAAFNAAYPGGTIPAGTIVLIVK